MIELIKLLGSTTVAQVLLILVSPILTRLYSPNVFGEFLVVASIFYILNSIALFKMDIAILKSSTRKEISQIFTFGCYSILFIVLIVLTILVGLELFYKFPVYFYLIPLMIFSLSSYQLIVSLFIRESKLNYVAGNKISQSLLLVFGQVFLGYFSGTVVSLMLAQSLSFLSVVLLNHNKIVHNFVFENPLVFLKKYKKFILYESLSNFFQVLSNNIFPLLIGLMLGGYIGGIYYMAYRVLITPVSIFSVSISQYISSKYISFFRSDIWGSYNDKGFNFIVFLFGVPFAILSAYIEFLVPFIFGSEWKDTGTLIKYFSIWIFLRLIYDSFSIHLSLESKSGVKMILDISIFLLNLIVFSLLLFLGFSGVHFLKIISYANGVIFILCISIFIFKVRVIQNKSLVTIFLFSFLIVIYPYIESFYLTLLVLFVYVNLLFYMYKYKNRIVK